ncbi:response regulator [Paraburkholderia sejongensis]|uniref:response regulator n=1 Tax=Paraburkholderia sejongensis TaxID=2886946 RepID=UPI003CE47080
MSIDRAATSSAIAPEDDPDEIFSTAATGLVVVIDDEQSIRSGMSSLLTGWGHGVIGAGSAREAIEILSARPNLVICDFRLRDGETGLQAIDQLRAQYDEFFPAMLITGDTVANCSPEARARGLVLLYKAVPSGKLRAAISNLIANGTGKSSSR